MDLIKFSPLIWNAKLDIKQTLSYITWILHLNVNIIGFKRTRNFFKCDHDHLSCHFPYYIFQNTLVKLLGISNDFPTFNIIFFKNKYYLLSHCTNMRPFLLNTHPITNFIFNNESYCKNDILKIITNKQVDLLFNVKIFTSYFYVRQTHTNLILSNQIGDHVVNKNKPTLFLFLSPKLTSDFDIHILEYSDSITRHKLDIYSGIHVKEGSWLYHKRTKNKEILLNQEHCICDHSDTHNLIIPTKKNYKTLGKNIVKVCFNYYIQCLTLFNYISNIFSSLIRIGLATLRLHFPLARSYIFWM